MYEHLASPLGSPPNTSLNALYKRWARGEWGMIITGNVQVDTQHLSLGRDVVIQSRPKTSAEEIKRFKEWAWCVKGEPAECRGEKNRDKKCRTLFIMQLNHTGRQSPNFIGGRLPFVAPKSSSATRVGSSTRSTPNVSFVARCISKLSYSLLFQTAREMTLRDIDEVVDEFVRGAQLAAEAGFDGVQLHAAHGCKW
jgi:2,4-dienoyl-CoA reductase-like NADH-dependent reductase (Old Yellow Enzyme family)